MGVDKATLVVDGRPLATIAGEALSVGGAAEVFAVGGDARRAAATGLRHVADRWPGEGPLGGVVTALDAAAHAVVVVLACDMPRVTAGAVDEVLAGLTPGTDAAVAVTHGRVHPLLAAYRRSCTAPFRRVFEAGGRSMAAALCEISVARVSISHPEWARNVNTPSELAAER